MHFHSSFFLGSGEEFGLSLTLRPLGMALANYLEREKTLSLPICWQGQGVLKLSLTEVL